MAKIARITTQKKHKDRYNIFLTNGHDEHYGFSVAEEVLITHHLHKGLELDEATIATLKKADTLQKAYTMALNYLSYRMRSIKEMADYLVKKEVDTEHCNQIMTRLINENLLNDQDFADSFVRTRIQTTDKGPIVVRQELQQKGVATSIADQALKPYTYEIQHERIEKLMHKKMKQTSKKSQRQQMQNLKASFIRKGYDLSIIQDILHDSHDELQDKSEWDALIYQGEKLLRKYQVKFMDYTLKRKLKEALYRKGFSIELINQFIDQYVTE